MTQVTVSFMGYKPTEIRTFADIDEAIAYAYQMTKDPCAHVTLVKVA